MTTRTLLAALALTTLPGLSACLAAHSTEALAVEASISSVTLAQDCPSAGAGAPEPGFAGDCAEGADGCGSWCQQSSLQLHLVASADGAEVPFEIVTVRVFDDAGALVSPLTTRNPRTFGDDGYAEWDQTIAPSETLDVAYDTTAPEWSSASSRLGWGTVYRVEVVIRIDGVERTLSADAMREPEIVT